MTTTATTSKKSRTRKTQKRPRRSTRRQLRMRGDRLLFALDVIHFFWDTMDGFAHVALDDAKEQDPRENPRGFSYDRAKRVFSRARYRDVHDPIDVGDMSALQVLRLLLHTVRPQHALADITTDALMAYTPWIPWDLMDRQDCADAYRELGSLSRFLRDIESERLTLKDFQEVV